MRAAVGTAVIAGTATAVSGRVARRQNRRYGAQPQADAYQQAPAAPMPAPVAAPAASSAMSPVEQIQMLAGLRENGDLTDAEFETEKAKILAS